MGFFKRTRELENFDDPSLDDSQWLGAGNRRYESLVSRHYGSPDTIAVGGDERVRLGDSAAALFFYNKAIDTMHSIYVCGFNDTGPSSWSRQPSPRDDSIVDRYLATLREVRAKRPSAPINASVTEATHRMRTISSQFRRYGVDPSRYLTRLDELARLTPDVDVSGVFW